MPTAAEPKLITPLPRCTTTMLWPSRMRMPVKIRPSAASWRAVTPSPPATSGGGPRPGRRAEALRPAQHFAVWASLPCVAGHPTCDVMRSANGHDAHAPATQLLHFAGTGLSLVWSVRMETNGAVRVKLMPSVNFVGATHEAKTRGPYGLAGALLRSTGGEMPGQYECRPPR